MTLFLIPGNDLIRAEDIKFIGCDDKTLFIHYFDYNARYDTEAIDLSGELKCETVEFPDDKSFKKAYKCLLGNHYSQWNAYIDSFGYESSGRETKLKYIVEG